MMNVMNMMGDAIFIVSGILVAGISHRRRGKIRVRWIAFRVVDITRI